jgi:hypothetical protein
MYTAFCNPLQIVIATFCGASYAYPYNLSLNLLEYTISFALVETLNSKGLE